MLKTATMVLASALAFGVPATGHHNDIKPVELLSYSDCIVQVESLNNTIRQHSPQHVNFTCKEMK